MEIGSARLTKESSPLRAIERATWPMAESFNCAGGSNQRDPEIAQAGCRHPSFSGSTSLAPDAELGPMAAPSRHPAGGPRQASRDSRCRGHPDRLRRRFRRPALRGFDAGAQATRVTCGGVARCEPRVGRTRTVADNLWAGEEGQPMTNLLERRWLIGMSRAFTSASRSSATSRMPFTNPRRRVGRESSSRIGGRGGYRVGPAGKRSPGTHGAVRRPRQRSAGAPGVPAPLMHQTASHPVETVPLGGNRRRSRSQCCRRNTKRSADPEPLGHLPDRQEPGNGLRVLCRKSA
jgi:hypothetical protein